MDVISLDIPPESIKFCDIELLQLNGSPETD